MSDDAVSEKPTFRWVVGEPLTRERLMREFHYDPLTGELRNLKPHARPIRGTQANIDGRNYYIHRLAWLWMTGEWPKHQVDHIDGNPKNNRFSNLREATDAENKQNSSSSKKGYTKHGSKFRVKVGLNGSAVYMGYFDTPEQAHEAYLQKKREVHPFFAERK